MLLVALAAGLAPVAEAGSRHAGHHGTAYRFKFQGSGSYGVDLISPIGEQGDVTSTFHWAVTYRPAEIEHRGILLRANRHKSKGGGAWSISSEND